MIRGCRAVAKKHNYARGPTKLSSKLRLSQTWNRLEEGFLAGGLIV